MEDLPTFIVDGVLPPGDYPLTIPELRRSMLGGGHHADQPTTWDSHWRGRLVDNLAIMVGQLHEIGVTEIYIDGSFVEDNDHPNDIDGYFVCEPARLFSGELERSLNLLDPHKVWTWAPESRRPYRGYAKKQLPMWHTYRVELYPHYGQLCGIRDAHGNELMFPAAFRQSRGTGQQKGIVQIIQEEIEK